MTEKEPINTPFPSQSEDPSSVGAVVPTDESICENQYECKDERFGHSEEMISSNQNKEDIIDSQNGGNIIVTLEDYDFSSVNQYTEVITPDIRVAGVSLIGRSHIATNEKCQDYHRYHEMGKGWHIFLLSDGAGSAKESHRGSKIVCEAGLKLIERALEKLEWYKSNYTPSDIEWNIEFTAICRKLKLYMEEQIEMLDEDVKIKDFNATLEVLIVTPTALLMGHVGDGRMGYQSIDNQWHSIMTPHKGEEKNQTIFVLNPWDKTRVPAYRIKGVFVPETRVVREHPKAIMLLSDGCENFSWNCKQYSEQGELCDINTPYNDFWDALKLELSKTTNYKLSFIQFIESYNEGCLTETDDRTMIFAEFTESKLNNENI